MKESYRIQDRNEDQYAHEDIARDMLEGLYMIYVHIEMIDSTDT